MSSHLYQILYRENGDHMKADEWQLTCKDQDDYRHVSTTAEDLKHTFFEAAESLSFLAGIAGNEDAGIASPEVLSQAAWCVNNLVGMAREAGDLQDVAWSREEKMTKEANQ